MDEILRIMLFAEQPIAKIDSITLERIIHRDFGNCVNEVKQKLQGVKSNRISAAIIKLAGKDINTVDKFVKISEDYRDVIMMAEYPRCLDLGLRRIKYNKKQIYITDWKEYSSWLNKK